MELKGLKITARRYGLLQKMGITTLEELIRTYPFRYEDTEMVPYEQWETKDNVTFAGLIATSPVTIRLGGNRTMTRFNVITWNQEIQVTVFNRPWASNFPFGKTLYVRGIYQGKNKVTALSATTTPPAPGLLPVYTIAKGMKPYDMKAIMAQALKHLDQIPDLVPPELRTRYRLLDKNTSLAWIHNPPDMKSLHAAVRTLKYEEFLCFQCAMQKVQTHAPKKKARIFDQKQLDQFIEELPFPLTPDQQTAIDAVLADMRSDKSMYRLVQGDVGCGKTIVAMTAIKAAQLSLTQSALMAPTEILARQHLKSLTDRGIPARLLVSSLPAKEKKEVLQGLEDGTISVVVGTHSLFQDPVIFNDLGLVITDEQQRFGVNQRRTLLEKGKGADFLMMSATPIPRTYAHFLYGDIDLSAIHTMPAGRKPVDTKFVRGHSMGPILKEVLAGLHEKRQCYVVCPAIDENLEVNIQAVTTIYEGMAATLKNHKVGLLHGRMSAQEKEDTMTRFAQGELEILVSTTVIEVGIDVANATMMVIYDADRFGLSTLHQLRGRCARGPKQGKCWLLSDTKDPDAISRLQKLEELKDGFSISEYDLKLRGPGDLLGTRQSGLPAFVLGDFEKDPAIMDAAAADAKWVMNEKRWLPMLKYVQQAEEKARYMD